MGYDEADRLVSLTTFRAAQEGDIAEDPTGRTDGDVTTWSYDDATGLETRKTYADGTHVDKTWDAFNRLATETNARGIVKTCTYEQARGLLVGINYSDATPGQSFAYDHLGNRKPTACEWAPPLPHHQEKRRFRTRHIRKDGTWYGYG